MSPGKKTGRPGTLIPGRPYWESVPLLGLSIVPSVMLHRGCVRAASRIAGWSIFAQIYLCNCICANVSLL
jgi:hypothetical protein